MFLLIQTEHTVRFTQSLINAHPTQQLILSDSDKCNYKTAMRPRQ